MDALLIIDMQEAMKLGPPTRQLDQVVERIRRLADRARAAKVHVIYIQHDELFR